MLRTTVSRVKCPVCTGPLALGSNLQFDLERGPKPGGDHEIRSGTLQCVQCAAEYLILQGIPLLVDDTEEYLVTHVKGISKLVKDHEIPEQFRDSYLEAKSELQTEHIEEDL